MPLLMLPDDEPDWYPTNTLPLPVVIAFAALPLEYEPASRPTAVFDPPVVTDASVPKPMAVLPVPLVAALSAL